jgi:hypothetical protein
LEKRLLVYLRLQQKSGLLVCRLWQLALRIGLVIRKEANQRMLVEKLLVTRTLGETPVLEVRVYRTKTSKIEVMPLPQQRKPSNPKLAEAI